MVTQQTTAIIVGSSNPDQPTLCGGGSGGIFAQPGFEPPTKKSTAFCITIGPMLDTRLNVSPLLGAVSATDKNPNCVYLCD